MDKKKRIVEKTKELISKKGYHATTIQDVAREARVAQGTPYLYFKNKEEMFIEIILSLFRQVDEILVESRDKEKDFWGRIERIIRRTGLFIKKHKEFINTAQSIARNPNEIGRKGREKLQMMKDSRVKKFNDIFKAIDREKFGIKGFTDDEIARFTVIVIEGVIERIACGDEKNPDDAAKFAVKCLKNAFGVA
ncbi:MAG: TetR/AcrR family transcriptional regulator [Endomicrobiales bacterium]|nr:TetR/AcrR family transcriptional regulator [Endomicrobiales bacterium]